MPLQTKPTQTVLTSAVSHAVQSNDAVAKQVHAALRKFGRGDWGSCSSHDAAMNSMEPESAMGNYSITGASEPMLWIKRDDYGDTYVVTVLFPSDY